MSLKHPNPTVNVALSLPGDNGLSGVELGEVSNENQEWDFYDDDAEDPAYNGAAENTENQFAPPFARPTDIAAVVPLEENADEFEISR